MRAKSFIILPLVITSISLLSSCNKKEEEKQKEDVGDLVYIRNTSGYCVDSLNNLDRSKITSIVVPETHEGLPVTEISKGAFKGCTNLNNITLPFIGHTAQSTGAGGLFGYVFGDEIWEGAGAYTWQAYSTSEEYDVEPTDYVQYVIPSNLKKVTITNASIISHGAFSMCNNLREIKFEDKCNVEEIGNFAFYTCTALKTINFPNGLKTIGRQAFCRNYNLFHLDIPSGVTTIKHNAFSNCISATRVTIPSSVDYMGKYVFQNFINGIILVENQEDGKNWDANWSNNSATIVYDYKGGGFYYIDNCRVAICGEGDNKYAFMMQWTGDTKGKIEIPGEVTVGGVKYKLKQIGPCAFSEETDLTEVTFNEGVELIHSNCFEKCSNIKTLNFPTSLKTIKSQAFIDCSSLTSLTFKKIQTIGNEAFKGCISLKEITSFGDSLIEIGDSAFEGNENILPPINTAIEGENCLLFPKTLKRIGDYAFKDCFKVQGVDSEGVAVKNNYIGLTLEEGNENKIAIGKHAFENAGHKASSSDYWGFLKFNFNNNNIEFKEGAFYNSYLYSIVNFPFDKISAYAPYTFYNAALCYIGDANNLKARDFYIKNVDTVPDYCFYGESCNFVFEKNNSKLKSIGAHSFRYCSNTVFKDLYIPDSVEEIKTYAFHGCSNILIVHLPNNEKFTKLDSVVFNNMTNLKGTYEGETAPDPTTVNTFTIPSSVNYLGASLFSGCKNLINIDIKGKINYVGSSTFSSCTLLETIQFEGGLGDPDSLTFGTSVFNGCTRLEQIKVKEQDVEKINWYPTNYVTSIGNDTYNNCKTLNGEFNIGANINIIGSRAFMNCDNLAGIKFNGSPIATINESAFSGCEKMSSFNMPESVHTICDNAFQNCFGLGSNYEDPDDTSAFVLPKCIYQTYDTTTKKGMGKTPFKNWGNDTDKHNQYIFFSSENVASKTNTTVEFKWGWTLAKSSVEVGGNNIEVYKPYKTDVTKFDWSDITGVKSSNLFFIDINK